ncbi:MAG: LysR family transcriptional regulator [Gammaproteobacteria bacterium]|nr:LysR family transcriptional regulator [Gammaproteobacteria bacterium]
MHVTLRQLQVFEAVARHLSYTQAAQELHLTQPAVSMQIKQLEENIGLALLEQLGKQTFLTEAGREMHHYSRSIAQQLTEASEVIEQLKGMKCGRLVIAVAGTANYFAPRLLAVFSRQYEGVTVSLDVTNRAGLLQHLEDNDSDMVIMGMPPKEMELDAAAFMDNPLVIIAPKDHELANTNNIPLSRLQRETFVVREQGSGTRIAMERFFTENGISITTGMEMSSNEAIKQAVEAGLGLGIVSLHTLELELETQRLVVLNAESFPILRRWYVVHRHGKRLSPVALAFKQFMLTEAGRLLHQHALA